MKPKIHWGSDNKDRKVGDIDGNGCLSGRLNAMLLIVCRPMVDVELILMHS
jgi:hypothetical protein